MPVVRTRLERLLSLTGLYDVEKLREILFNLKCETEVESDGTILIEVQSDRIDMFSIEGIAYAIRLYTGLEITKAYKAKTVFKVYVDPPKKRPYIAVAAVKGVKLDELALKDLIEFQERLHTTYGRNRKRIAIGLHDLTKFPLGKITYKDINIDIVKMVPLFNSRRMSIKEVLELTDQGKAYGTISLYDNMHPALIVGEEVIALPPVINSDITRLEPTTRDVFIDITGTDLDLIMRVLNVIVHSLSFYNGEILGAEIYYPDKTITTPNLESRKMNVDIDFASKWLGISRELIIDEGVKALQRMGYTIDSINQGRLSVVVPMYRCDTMHQVDIVEDIAIGLGYNNIGLEFISSSQTSGKIRKSIRDLIARIIRETLIGLGYTEINTLTLVPSDIVKIVSNEPYAEIINALSKELNALRNSLAQSILIVLRNSQYITQPVKIFEIGEIVERCDECYNGWRNRLKGVFAVMDSEIRFEDIHSDLYTIFSELEIEKSIEIESCRHKIFIDGRCGRIKYRNMPIGVIGEIHPEILKMLSIEYPIAVVELCIDTLAKVIKVLKDVEL